MATVNYQGNKVSNANVRRISRVISDLYQRPVFVTSGDRSFRPKGSPPTSLHLQHRAADLYVQGLTLQYLYDGLKQHIGDIFDPIQGYEVIYHGTYTATTGPHVHIGHYAHRKHGGNVLFMTEGLNKATKGQYSVQQRHIPMKAAPTK